MFVLSFFARWGLLGAPKCDTSKIEREGVPWPLMAALQTIHATTNQKPDFSEGRIFGRSHDCGGRGGVIPSFGAANWATKYVKNK